MLGFWGVVVVAVTAVIRSDRDELSRWSRAPPYGKPLRLLEERFARGEVDIEDYQLRRELLSNF